MKRYKLIPLCLALLAGLAACTDDDSFSTSPDHLLTFSQDTLSLDTVFSTVPSASKSFWVYNHSGDGIRLSSVSLADGSTSGFRVNVDGRYLSADAGYSVSGVEVRNKDSVRVFVELTSAETHLEGPQKVSDDLVFTLESGVQQRINLNAYSWDALLLKNVHITKDSTLTAGTKPVVVYGGITVDSAATFTLGPGLTLYFHNDAGMDVKGTLVCNGTADQPVTLRGDRIDRMFDYLPYDRTPGQWQGVRLHASSYNNVLTHVDLHSAYNGLVADSSDVEVTKLTLESSTIHNCQGYGLWAANARMSLTNTQITNTLNDCLYLAGGHVDVNACTLAQFYPFDSNRGVAIRFTSLLPLEALTVSNSLITGYADDQLMGEQADTTKAFNYAFDHCLIRTPRVTTADSVHFTNVIYETSKDTVGGGEKHFKVFDTENLVYDFALDSVSMAIGKADPATSPVLDHQGVTRDKEPDLGAYEYVATEKKAIRRRRTATR
jgi:hypothetical protein